MSGEALTTDASLTMDLVVQLPGVTCTTGCADGRARR